MELMVKPEGRVLHLNTGDLILDALRAADIPISYSCEDGRCGLCRCKVIRGEVFESTRPPRQMPHLTGSYVLACQSTLVDDCVIEIPESSEVTVHRPRALKATVKGISPLAKNVRSLRLEIPKDFTYSPGQFVDIKFKSGMVRSYSMADPYAHGVLQFHIRLHPFGRASNYIEHEVSRGQKITVRGPLGSSYLREHNGDPIIMAAASTGLAPMLAILRAMSKEKMANPVHIYLGFMLREDIYGMNELEEILQELHGLQSMHRLVAYGPLGSEMRRGLLTTAIDEDFKDLGCYRSYVFGSPYATEATIRLLLRKGLSEDHLYADPFYVTGD